MITDQDLIDDLAGMLDGSPGSSSFSHAEEGGRLGPFPCIVLKEVVEDDSSRLVDTTVFIASQTHGPFDAEAEIVIESGTYKGRWVLGPNYSGHPGEYKTVLERVSDAE